MYDQFYGFSGRPFQLTPDPFFYFESGTHRKAMSYLGYGLAQGEGFIVITGEIGAGKTTLVGHLMNTIDPNRLTAVKLVSTQVEGDDLLRLVAQQFALPWEGLGKAELLRSLEQYLREQARAGRRTLLIVDEGQNLAISALEELRMLSNFQLGGHSLLQIFLLGQPEFRDTLFRSPTLEQLRQRVIATHHLEAMEAEEVEPYILHRLSKVGWQGNPELSQDAYDLIYDHSEGVPRKLNVLMSRILLYGAIEQLTRIDAEDVRAVINDIASEGGLDQIDEAPVAPQQAYAAAPLAYAPAPVAYAPPAPVAYAPPEPAYAPQPVPQAYAPPEPAYAPQPVPQAYAPPEPAYTPQAVPEAYAPPEPTYAPQPEPVAALDLPAFAPPAGMTGASVQPIPVAPVWEEPEQVVAAVPQELPAFAAPGQHVAYAPPVAAPEPEEFAPPVNNVAPFAPPPHATPQRAFPSPIDDLDPVEPLPMPGAARNFLDARSLVADPAMLTAPPQPHVDADAVEAPAAPFDAEPAAEQAPARAPFVPAHASPFAAPPLATSAEPLPYGVTPFGPPPGAPMVDPAAIEAAAAPFGQPTLVSPQAATSAYNGGGFDQPADVVALQRQLAGLESRMVDQDVALRRVLDLLIDWVERDPANAPAMQGWAA